MSKNAIVMIWRVFGRRTVSQTIIIIKITIIIIIQATEPI